MKFISIAATIGATLALQASGVAAKLSHLHPNNVLDRRHRHHAREAQTSKAEAGPLELRESSVEVHKRGGQCQFPSDAGLVAVTPGAKNAGWAMSPDQPCVPGSYCPYACPPGQMMAQWDPSATSYIYPQSMVGHAHVRDTHGSLTPLRTADYTVTTVGILKSLSPTSLIVWAGPPTSVLSTRQGRSCLSARPCYPAMKPC
jgi:hypothetical protein